MAAGRAWMYRQPRVWETFLSGVNGFLAQAEADMRNRMCPQCIAHVLNVSARRSSDKGTTFFIIWSHMDSKRITRVGTSMVRKALMKLKKVTLLWPSYQVCSSYPLCFQTYYHPVSQPPPLLPSPSLLLSILLLSLLHFYNLLIC